MNCRRATKLVYDFLDGLVADKERLELEKHLCKCRECETMATQLTRSLDLIRRAPQEQPEENFNWKVRLGVSKERRAIEERLSSQGSMFRSWNARYAATALASFGIVLVAGLLAFRAGVIPLQAPTPLAQQAEVVVGSDPRVDVPVRGESPTREVKLPILTASNPIARLVTWGDGLNPHTNAPVGAIDQVSDRNNLDSLVRTEMERMTEDERIRYLQRRIHLLQSHLEKCEINKRAKPTPGVQR